MDAIKLYEAMYANEKYSELRKRLPNEEVSRERMKERPPHILFTNYAMLKRRCFFDQVMIHYSVIPILSL